MDTIASSFSTRSNAKRAAEQMIAKGTAPPVEYRIKPRDDGRFEIVEGDEDMRFDPGLVLMEDGPLRFGEAGQANRWDLSAIGIGRDPLVSRARARAGVTGGEVLTIRAQIVGICQPSALAAIRSSRARERAQALLEGKC